MTCAMSDCIITENMLLVSVIAGKCSGFKRDLECKSKGKWVIIIMCIINGYVYIFSHISLTEQLELLCKVHDEVYHNLHKN